MNLLVNGHNVFLIVFVTFLTSVLLVPLVMKAAKHVNAMDIPNQRSAHSKPMPRMGGLAIFGAFLLGYMLFARTSLQMLSILIGGFIIVLTGVFDDISIVSLSKITYSFIRLIGVVAERQYLLYSSKKGEKVSLKLL